MSTSIDTKGNHQREITLQLNTRVSLATRDLIDSAAQANGLSIREVIERALAATWGSGTANEGIRNG